MPTDQEVSKQGRLTGQVLGSYEYYKLELVRVVTFKNQIYNAAPVTCSLCGTCLAGGGSPNRTVICLPCAEKLERGALRGIVKPT